MKFKKLLSAAVALTMSITFAGNMGGGVARAASSSVTYSYTVDGGDAISATLTVEVSGCEIDNVAYTDKNSVEKTAVGVKGGGGSGNRFASSTLSSKVSAALVTVDSYIVLQAGNNDASATYFKLVDEDGNNLLRVGMDGNNTTTVSVQGGGDENAQTTTSLATKIKDSTIGNGSSSYGNTGWIELKAVFNFSTYTGTVTLGTESFTVSLLSTSAGVNSIQMQGGRGYGAALLSGLTFTTASSPADTFTINYVDASGTKLANPLPTNVSTYSIGDDYTYTYSKYLVYNGNLYKTTAEKTKITTQLSSNQSVDVVYALDAEGDYTFYECDGGYTTRAEYESNGSAGASNDGVTVFTATKSGIYDVTVNGYGGSSNRTITLKKVASDGTTTALTDATTLSIYAGGTDIKATDVALAAGESISAVGSASTAYVDYAFINRTSDYYTADISTVGELDTSAETLTYTSTLKNAYSAGTAVTDAMAEKGYVFVTLTDDAATATKHGVTETGQDGTTGLYVGESFRVKITDDALASAKSVGVYAVPYVYITSDDDSVVWGTPCAGTDVTTE